MSEIKIRKISITDLDADCIVNAANDRLAAGGGVCGAIFRAAGYAELTEACDAIGHCPTGSAVITPGFRLKAKYIIHAVGPVWHGGDYQEPQALYQCYQASLKLAMEYGCHSIGFPLISAGIYGYPIMLAWMIAIRACRDYTQDHVNSELQITFCVLDDEIMELGNTLLSEMETYFVTEDKRAASNHTCYMEFQRGPYRDQCWLADSISIQDILWDAFDLTRLFESVIPDFDYYDTNAVTKAQWEQIVKLCSKKGSLWNKVIAEAAPWVEQCFEEYDIFTIVGM